MTAKRRSEVAVAQRLVDLEGLQASECSLREKVALTRLSAAGFVRFEPCPAAGWVAMLTAAGRAALVWGMT